MKSLSASLVLLGLIAAQVITDVTKVPYARTAAWAPLILVWAFVTICVYVGED